TAGRLRHRGEGYRSAFLGPGGIILPARKFVGGFPIHQPRSACERTRRRVSGSTFHVDVRIEALVVSLEVSKELGHRPTLGVVVEAPDHLGPRVWVRCEGFEHRQTGLWWERQNGRGEPATGVGHDGRAADGAWISTS